MCEYINVNFGRGTTTKFKKVDLMQLAYFRHYFSRWECKHQNNEKKNDIETLDLFGDFEPIFIAADLTLLLHCFQLQRIPIDENEVLTVGQLDGLTFCADFLSCKDDAENNGFTLTKVTLLYYFKNRIPSMTIEERQSILKSSKSRMVKETLIQWNDELDITIANLVHDIIENHDLMEATDVAFDITTASDLFMQKFDPKMNGENSVIKIIIPNCETGQLLVLWEQRKESDETGHVKYEYEILNGCIFPKIVEALETPDLSKLTEIKFGSEKQEFLTKKIIKDVCDDFINKHIDTTNVNIDFNRVLKCYIRLGYETPGIWLRPHKILKHYLSHVQNAKGLLVFLLNKHEKYSANYHISENSKMKQELANGLQSWHSILRIVICKCSNNDIIQTIHSWFAALNDKFLDENEQVLSKELHANSILKVKQQNYHESTATWIKLNLFSRFNANETTKFAMFLTDYLVIIRKHNDKFSQIYLDLIKNYLGITWNLLPQM